MAAHQALQVASLIMAGGGSLAEWMWRAVSSPTPSGWSNVIVPALETASMAKS